MRYALLAALAATAIYVGTFGQLPFNTVAFAQPTAAAPTAPKPPKDSYTEAEQLQLLQAAANIGGLAYCQTEHLYRSTRLVSAYNRLRTIFLREGVDDDLKELGRTTYMFLQMARQTGQAAEVVKDGDKDTLRAVEIKSEGECLVAEAVLLEFMKTGGVLDVPEYGPSASN